MDKTAIKNYAIWARVQLIESCKQRAFEYGVTEDGNYASNLKTIGSRVLTDQEVEQRNQLISQAQQKGYAQVMEEAAYTWFNRFIALRFMEVNGYLPSKVRVFTDESGAFKPEILKEAMTVDLEGIDKSRVIELLERQDNEELYKYLLITQCNALSEGLPYMFEKISNWTELLFPANLLRCDSVVGRMITDIPEEDWTDAVQIIGWLYQYYNSELKDETFALLKKNVKITKERIPAATQLFTPDWIVRYMVENSLGRLWYEGHKGFDKSQWKYYLDEAEQEPEVEAELAKIREEYSKIKPEDIKVIDPCMGSGHILVYAFDVLMQIYTSDGWSERDAAKSILENNLYGLDIDDRAGQLAYFAVMMKARKYSRRIMSLDIKPNVMSIQDSSFMTNELIDFVAGSDARIKADLRHIKEVFTDAKEYGSILNVPSLGYEAILGRVDELQNTVVEDIFQIEYRNVAVEQLRPLIRQAMIMSQKYDVVVTNPPYMSSSGMTPSLGDYIKQKYPKSKADMSTVMMEKTIDMCKHNSFMTMINIPVWMSLVSFEKLRTYLLGNYHIVNMLHCGRGIFGSDFGTTTFVFRKSSLPAYNAQFRRLFEKAGDVEQVDIKKHRFFSGTGEYISNTLNFSLIPGMPVAYWASSAFLKLFANKSIRDYAYPVEGIKSGDNDTFLRVWQEVDATKIGKINQYREGITKWCFTTKGGAFRKWYGNIEYIIDWTGNGTKLKNTRGTSIYKESYWHMPAITWTYLTAGSVSFRALGEGMLYNNKGPAIFSEDYQQLLYICGLINSKVGSHILSFLCSTLTFLPGDMKKIPLIFSCDKDVDSLVVESIGISQKDWDSFETSWDFKKHPLI